MPSLLGFSIGEMRGRGAVGFRLDYAVSVPSAGSVLRTNSHASARQPYLRLCSARKQNSEKNLYVFGNELPACTHIGRHDTGGVRALSCLLRRQVTAGATKVSTERQQMLFY
jgi:hypothetical protein